MSETICKFYLQGNCRFGNNCKFSHSSNRNSTFNRFSDPNRFSYVNPEEKLKQKMKQKVGSAESIADIIMNDFKNWLPSKVWPFSCYCVNSLENMFPELNDLSFEEARFAYANAFNNGTTNQHIQDVLATGRKTEDYIASVAKATKQELLVLIRERLESEENSTLVNSTPENPFGSGNMQSGIGNQNSTQNIFMSNTAPTSVFSNEPSFPLSQQPSSNIFQSSSENIFASNNNSSGTLTTPNSASSMFSSNQSESNEPANPFLSGTRQCFANESPFGNVFGKTDNKESIFGNSDMSSSKQEGSIFGTPNSNTVFGQSTFSEKSQSFPTQQISSGIDISGNDQNHLSLFKSTENLDSSAYNMGNSLVQSFNKTESENPFKKDPLVSSSQTYMEDISRIPKLSEKDLLQYKSQAFEWGQIPECPPPPELCT